MLQPLNSIHGLSKNRGETGGTLSIRRLVAKLFDVDWLLLGASVFLMVAGLITMNSFVGDNSFFQKQVAWVGVSLVLFFALSLVDWRFLRRTNVIIVLFALSAFLLVLLFIVGTVTKGAISRFDFGIFFVQPSDPIKLVLILLLAKYFSRRHIEITHYRHIIVSALYTGVLFILVFLQPDFGSAVIIGLIWLGMVLVSGISKKHLAFVVLISIVTFALAWGYVFEDYQRDRILTFINPLTDLTGAGYNANQSMIAVGSGQLFGKGVGFGTQSRLQFLPEYETDFIFAAFAEEWGFVGVLVLFTLFGVVLWRILVNAYHGATNFEILFGLGLAVLFASHIAIHVGMNIGILPVTGTTLPFLSYGGSHLAMEFMGLGVLMGMRRYGRTLHKEKAQEELMSYR